MLSNFIEWCLEKYLDFRVWWAFRKADKNKRG